MIDLQKLLHELYDAAGYADYIYSGSPRPAITDDDQAWAADIVSSASRR